MKKHHKMLSVGGAVLAVLVIAFLYKHNSKEGNTTMRAAQKLSVKQEEGIIAAIFAFFASILETLGLSKPKASVGAGSAALSARDRASAAARSAKRTPPSPRGITGGAAARGAAGRNQRPAAKRPAPKRPAPKGPAGKRPAGPAAAGRAAPAAAGRAAPAAAGRAGPAAAGGAGGPAPAPAGGPEPFTTMQRGGAWRPRGSIAPM